MKFWVYIDVSLRHVLLGSRELFVDHHCHHRSNFCYEQQIKRDLKETHISGCRCNERLKDKTDGSTRLTDTGLCGELEHLKIETRLILCVIVYLLNKFYIRRLCFHVTLTRRTVLGRDAVVATESRERLIKDKTVCLL